jgi:hypothetical protein
MPPVANNHAKHAFLSLLLPLCWVTLINILRRLRSMRRTSKRAPANVNIELQRNHASVCEDSDWQDHHPRG